MAYPPKVQLIEHAPDHETGFTLVEVTLALGLIGFCLVALFGLLPAGLGSLRDAKNEAAATNCLEQIAASIRTGNLLPASTTKYRASGPYQPALAWEIGGTPVKATLTNLSAGGFPDSDGSAQKFVAYAEITPPPDLSVSDPTSGKAMKTGFALITVAWPVQASWDVSLSRWKNAQGSVLTRMVFLPSL